MALRSLLQHVKQEEELDIMKTVFKLRNLRPKLVQTQEQYSLLYQVREGGERERERERKKEKKRLYIKHTCTSAL